MTTVLCRVMRGATTVKVLSMPGQGFKGKNSVRREEESCGCKVGGGGGGVGHAGTALRPAVATSRESEKTIRSPGVL